MILLNPIWLLLLIPLGAVLWVWKMPSRLLLLLRGIVLLLLTLALCQLAVRLPSRAGTIVVVADRSFSMPTDSQAKQKETIELVQKAMPSEDRLAVVSFGEKVGLEKAPFENTFADFVTEVGGNGSALTQALETALALIPPELPGRMLILSDGRWTGRDPVTPAAQAAARNIAIDYRLMQRTVTYDVAISHIDAPQSVTPGESFMITAWISSPVQQELTYELKRRDRRLASGKRLAPSGLSRLTFRDQAGEPGTQQYTLTIQADRDDPVPENNRAKLLVGVAGPRAVLCVTGSDSSGLASVLRRGGLQVRTAEPQFCRWSLEDLSNYSAVLIENVPADKIGTRAMENISAWVQQSGSGLMMTGGKLAYGPGGYFRSPLEPIMPVSMELRREHRKLSLAVVIALDRSGSMSMQVGGGRTKMDLANLASVQVLELLSPMDELGVVAVDSAAHVIARCQSIGSDPSLRSKILSIDSRGGGIFVYTALSHAAQMLSEAQSETKHIILFADAADAEEPGKYQELLTHCRASGMTVSVIGLGKETDTDAEFLRDVARRGEGRIFFTENPHELPRLFAQDTFVVARSTFVDEPTDIRLTSGMISLSQKQFSPPPAIGGYNLCYLREGANLAALTQDEYEAPVVAAWQAGIGRTLCYTGQADGKYTGNLAQWQDLGDFFTSLTRWTAGEPGNFTDKVLITQKVQNGICNIQAHLDPERQGQPFGDPPRIITLRAPAGMKPQTQERTMHWTNADTLEVEIPLNGSETMLSTVEVEGLGRVSLAPVTMPYSPEYQPVSADEGGFSLAQLARTTGGKDRIDLGQIWKELPRQMQLIEVGPYLVLAAIVLFLLEILERRTGVLSLLPKPVLTRVRKIVPKKKPVDVKRVPHKRRVKLAAAEVAVVSGDETTTPPEPTAPKEPVKEDRQEEADMLDALQQARHRARRRRQ